MAIIGRAREPRAEVELELMRYVYLCVGAGFGWILIWATHSSTSEEVCELWNGNCIVRVLGAPDVLEIMYHQKAEPDASICGIYTLHDLPVVWRQHWYPGHIRSTLWKSLKGLFRKRQRNYFSNTAKGAPNISLNTTGQHTARWETLCVAIVGVVLQLGVVVYEGMITYPLHWEKGDQDVVGYAFPVTAVGTLAISMGMFVCAYVIEASTKEVEYLLKVDETPLELLWLQRRQSVSDQQFASYAIHAKRRMRTMWTSRPREGGRQHEGLTSFAVLFSIVGKCSSTSSSF